MRTEPTAVEPQGRKVEVKYGSSSADAVYGIGLIGAWVFYLSRAKSFQEGAIGFLKGIFWPAFMVYALLKYLEKE
jgi:hypothetical protein